MEVREYLRACQTVAVKREQERRKLMDRVMSVVLVALFWAALFAAYMLK